MSKTVNRAHKTVKLHYLYVREYMYELCFLLLQTLLDIILQHRDELEAKGKKSLNTKEAVLALPCNIRATLQLD